MSELERMTNSIDGGRSPAVCMITGNADEETLVRQVARALEAGVDLVQLRRKGEAAGRLEALARRLRDLGPGVREKILVNDRLDVALALELGGVHLPADGLPVAEVRRVSPSGFLVGRSTHSREEVARAAREGASFVVLGPVFPTTSHPGARAMGVSLLAEIASSVDIPVMALGGVSPDRARAIASLGVGIAGISLFESEESLRALFRELKEPREERKR